MSRAHELMRNSVTGFGFQRRHFIVERGDVLVCLAEVNVEQGVGNDDSAHHQIVRIGT